MANEVRIAATKRTEFGKGSARRTRREGKIPAVLYGHGTDPVHLALAGHELTMALRQGGVNTLLTIAVDGEDQLALPKALQIHPLRRVINHVDLLIVRRGEKVTVDVPVIVIGEVAPGAQVNQDLTSLSVEAEATAIPESFEVSIEGLEVGAQVLAGEITLPAGTTMLSDPESLILAINEQLEAEVESELDAEEPVEGDEAADGEQDDAADGDTSEGEQSEGSGE